jgi:hypothetical protein
MAERLYDVAWTMRERGLDPATCEEIETLASSILAASSLQDPADHRAQKLKEVLQYLERRIGSMLNAGAQAGPMPPEGLIPPIQPAAAAAPTEPAPPMARPMPRTAPNYPLAALKATTDEERIALFT